jgi:NADPH-dependent curcumin reductase CurA
MTPTTREWHLTQRPAGLPGPDSYTLVERTLGPLEQDQFLVRNLALSVDPYMRPRMDDAPSYVPPFELEQPLTGAAVGEVIETRSEVVPVGSWVVHQAGWREHAVLDAKTGRLLANEVAARGASDEIGWGGAREE